MVTSHSDISKLLSVLAKLLIPAERAVKTLSLIEAFDKVLNTSSPLDPVKSAYMSPSPFVILRILYEFPSPT